MSFVRFFVIFRHMKGRIKGVAFNIARQMITVHLSDGESVEIPMTEDEWRDGVSDGTLEETIKRRIDDK